MARYDLSETEWRLIEPLLPTSLAALLQPRFDLFQIPHHAPREIEPTTSASRS